MKKIVMFGVVNANNEFVFEGKEGFYYTPLRAGCLMSKKEADTLKKRLDKRGKLFLNPDNDDKYDGNLSVIKVELEATFD